MRLLLHWVLSAVAILLVSNLVRGFRVDGFVTALIAAVVIGFINGTIGALIKIVTLPFTIVTFGVFLLFINAFMLMVASWILPGFRVSGFGPAFWGALLLSLLNMLIRSMLKESKAERE